MTPTNPPSHFVDGGTWSAFLVTCPHCSGEFVVQAEDRLKLTCCPFCMGGLPVAEGMIQ